MIFWKMTVMKRKNIIEEKSFPGLNALLIPFLKKLMSDFLEHMANTNL